MNGKIVVSPCISICKSDPITGFCYGCGRSNDDKINWKKPETTNIWKEENLLILRKRLTGWQKNAFNKSYQYKKEKGISLIKQSLIDSKK